MKKKKKPNALEDRSGSAWLFPAIMLSWIAIVAFSAYRYQGPPVQPEDCPATVFSAERAYRILDEIVGDNLPHESGSAQNKIVRQRIVDVLERFGYEVEQQAGSVIYEPDNRKIDLVNLVTRLKGRNHGSSDQQTMIVLSHYDSKPKAAGVADDGVGVAVCLEIARMLKLDTPPEHDILFVITDGEELGLLSAHAFIKSKQTDPSNLVINLEARGTCGPSLMFETNADNALAIPRFDRAVNRPFGSSLFYEVYRWLPNNTDFSVFKDAGYAGYNFAFIGNVKYYHTLNDNLQNVDHKSIQHHGDNLLGLLRELDGQEQFRPRDDELSYVVYFDFFGYKIFSWPHYWSFVFLLIGIVGHTIAYARLKKNEFFKSAAAQPDANSSSWLQQILRAPRSAGFAYTGGFLITILMFVFSLHVALDSGEALGPGWVNDALLVETSYWSIAICAAFLLVWIVDRRYLAREVYFATVMLWLMFAIGTVALFRGGSYLFTVPLLVSGVLALITSLVFKKHAAMLVFFCLAFSVGLFWLPLERMFYDAIGFRFALILIVRVVVVCTCLLPGLMMTRLSWISIYGVATAFIGVICSLVAVVFE